MKRWLSHIKILSVLLLSLQLVVPQLASADVNDFVIQNFDAKYELFADQPGGRMRVTENIDLTFTDNNHGILRAIPKSYKDASVDLRVLSVSRDGVEEPYTTYGQSGNEVLKIGRAESTITGKHSYQIVYEVKKVISFYPDYDELYWDVNGNDWLQPFVDVRAEVHLPEGPPYEELPFPVCYTGVSGSTAQNCDIEATEFGFVVTSTGALRAGEGLSFVAPIRKGVIAQPTWRDWVRGNWWQITGLVVALGLVVHFYRLWWRHGKDYAGRGTIIPEYDAPKGLGPAEVGLLMDYNLDGRDVTATIIDLAVRGYIRIHDDQKKTLGLFKNHEFSFELTKTDVTKLKPYERQLVEAIFSTMTLGEITKTKDIDKTKMYKAVTDIKKKVKNSLVKTHGLIEENPNKAIVQIVLLSAAYSIFAMALGRGAGWVLGIVCVIATGVLLIFLMRRRSHAGVQAYEHVQGLKLYMNVAEKQRLKMMQSVDRPYAPPDKTVKLFETLLPFAIALGVEKSWAGQFENIYTEEPSWYTGNYAAFSAGHLASSVTSSVSSINSSFSAPSSSGSSGYSGGGGFSGGGGGGGGGGGW